MYLNPEQILPTGVASSNLKLHLPMNEGVGNLYDGSGNQNHGTITGATWVKAETDIAQVGLVRQNKPMVFGGAGSGDYLDLGTPTALDPKTGGFSISAWVYTAATAEQTILTGYDSSTTDGYIFSINSSNKLSLQMYESGTGKVVRNDTGLSINTWIHLVGTFNRDGGANGLSLYKNGSELSYETRDDISSLTGNIASTGNKYLGRAWNTTNGMWTGLISDVAVWDEALTAQEVTALYNSGTPLDASADSGNYASSDGLQGYWRNDGDTTWTDRSTNSNDGTVAGSPASIVLTEGITSGRDSQGFYLKDTGENVLTLNGAEYVEVGSAMSYTNHTISGWFNLSELGSNRIVFDARDANDDGIRLMHNWGGLFYYQLNGSDVTKTTPSINEWIHIACTYDGTTQKLYFDGVLESSATTSQVVSTTVNAVIGSLSYGSKADSWKGLLDDIKVYSDALSATEVTKNYNAGLSKHRN